MQQFGYIKNRTVENDNERKRAEMLQNINELKVVLNGQGLYDIMVNGVTVSEMVAKPELADAIEGVLKDEHGMVANMLNEED